MDVGVMVVGVAGVYGRGAVDGAVLADARVAAVA